MNGRDDIGEMRVVVESALDRYRMGKKKYGAYDPETDHRDPLCEAEEELLDCMMYCGQQVLKLRSLRLRLRSLGMPAP